MLLGAVHRSLLLNASYEPLGVVSWQKALILWLQDKVDVLEYHSATARSARASFQLPSILRLKRYIQPRRDQKVRFSRENVYLRDKFTCQYCAEEFPPRELTLDHVVPASKQGEKSWTNVVTACRECNQKKGNRTPHEARMPLLKKPEQPRWLPNQDLDESTKRFPPTWSVYLQKRSSA